MTLPANQAAASNGGSPRPNKKPIAPAGLCSQPKNVGDAPHRLASMPARYKAASETGQANPGLAEFLYPSSLASGGASPRAIRDGPPLLPDGRKEVYSDQMTKK